MNVSIKNASRDELFQLFFPNLQVMIGEVDLVTGQLNSLLIPVD
jgi:hypothetical protein